MSLTARAARLRRTWAWRSPSSGPTRWRLHRRLAQTTSTTSACGPPRSRCGTAARTGPSSRSPRPSRTPSPRYGRGAAESDSSTPWSSPPVWTGARSVILRALAATLRQVGGPQPGLHRGGAGRQPGDRRGCSSSCSRPASTPTLDRGRRGAAGARPSAWTRRSTQALDEVASLDQDRILRARRGGAGRPAHQLLPARREGAPKATSASSCCRASSTMLPEPRPAFEIWVYAPRVEGCHLRFGAVARGGLRWSDRREDFRTEVLGSGQGADGQERRHRADRVQGRLRRQAAARPGRRPRRLAGRGQGGLPHLHLAGCSTSPTTASRQRDRAPAAGGAPRRRRPLPGGRGRQGHGDLLRHRQRGGAQTTASGSTTPSPRAVLPATTTRDGHHRPRCVGVGQAPLPRAGAGHPERASSPSSASAT